MRPTILVGRIFFICRNTFLVCHTSLCRPHFFCQLRIFTFCRSRSCSVGFPASNILPVEQHSFSYFSGRQPFFRRRTLLFCRFSCWPHPFSVSNILPVGQHYFSYFSGRLHFSGRQPFFHRHTLLFYRFSSQLTFLCRSHFSPSVAFFRRHTLIFYLFLYRPHPFSVSGILSLPAAFFYNNVHSAHRIFAGNTHVLRTCFLHIKRIFLSLPAIFMLHAIIYCKHEKTAAMGLKTPAAGVNQSPYQNRCALPPAVLPFCGTSGPDFRYHRTIHSAVHVLSNRVQDAASLHEVRAPFIIVQHAAPCAFSIRPYPQVRARKKAAKSRLFPYIRFLSIRRISLCCPRFGSGHPMPAKHALRGIR